jgi:hypothetical protein
MKTSSFPMFSVGSMLLGVVLGVLPMRGAAAAPPGTDPTTSDTCKMTTTFPDHSTFAEACLVTIVLPGQETLAPKGWVKIPAAMTFGTCQCLHVRVMSTAMEPRIRKDIQRRPQALV